MITLDKGELDIMYQILIVDDEAIERETICFLLKKYQFNLDVTQAGNGREALRILNERRFDILLTDIKMPFIDGLSLADQARDLYPDIEVIIFSGYGDFQYAKRALTLHVFDYILKPINPQEFRQTMTAVLEHIRRKDVSRPVLTAPPSPAAEHEQDNEHAILMVKQYIRQHYGEDLSLDILADAVCLSPKYLSSLFIRENGYGINRYIKNIRMEEAKRLLQTTNMKISAISKKTGYSNLSYFCKSFQEHYGMSPDKFRQTHPPDNTGSSEVKS